MLYLCKEGSADEVAIPARTSVFFMNIVNSDQVVDILKIDVPGFKTLSVENAVLDMNGTIAVDGVVSEAVKQRLVKLAEIFTVYVLTADTQGTAARELEGLPVVLRIFSQNDSAKSKLRIVEGLEGGCVCVGNGRNDCLMFKAAQLSIAVLDTEGAYAPLLAAADLLVRSGEDALDLIMDKKRLVSGLRG